MGWAVSAAEIRQPYTVASLRTARCQARPDVFEEEMLKWDVEGVVVADLNIEEDDDEGPDLILIGELFVHTRKAAAAATVEAMISYEDREFAQTLASDREVALAETQRIAREQCNVLYDTAADVVRTLATFTRAQLEVPVPTQPFGAVTLWESGSDDVGGHEPEKAHSSS